MAIGVAQPCKSLMPTTTRGIENSIPEHVCSIPNEHIAGDYSAIAFNHLINDLLHNADGSGHELAKSVHGEAAWDTHANMPGVHQMLNHSVDTAGLNFIISRGDAWTMTDSNLVGDAGYRAK